MLIFNAHPSSRARPSLAASAMRAFSRGALMFEPKAKYLHQLSGSSEGSMTGLGFEALEGAVDGSRVVASEKHPADVGTGMDPRGMPAQLFHLNPVAGTFSMSW